MEKKYTQGEWKARNIKEHPRFDNLPSIVDSENNLIAELGGGEVREVEANAKLIAAAPDLLEALKRFISGHLKPEDIDFALDAVIKATE